MASLVSLNNMPVLCDTCSKLQKFAWVSFILCLHPLEMKGKCVAKGFYLACRVCVIIALGVVAMSPSAKRPGFNALFRRSVVLT